MTPSLPWFLPKSSRSFQEWQLQSQNLWSSTHHFFFPKKERRERDEKKKKKKRKGKERKTTTTTTTKHRNKELKWKTIRNQRNEKIWREEAREKGNLRQGLNIQSFFNINCSQRNQILEKKEIFGWINECLFSLSLFFFSFFKKKKKKKKKKVKDFLPPLVRNKITSYPFSE